jgi:uncharacterized membrane protein
MTAQPPPTPAARMVSPGRLEAFSDGVLAIAITLLSLDLRVPEVEHGLRAALAHQWPAYAAFLVSFLVIGVIWVNHHGLFANLARVDRGVLLLNVALLGTVSAIPFATALMAAYLRAGGADGRTAAVVYSLVMATMGAVFVLLWLYLRAHPHLLADPAVAGPALRRSLVGPPVYLAAAAVGAASTYACLLLHAVIALFFALSRSPGPGREGAGGRPRTPAGGAA